MFAKCSRSLVKGFLKAQDTKIVNDEGDEILLAGWGLGNWLLPEGYMWLAGDNKNFDRPRRIEKTIEELTGSAFAETFWREYRDRYISEADIWEMARLGYNSVRIPIHWRILMREEPGIHFREDGFALLDRCIGWCERYGLYVFLDLHAAPGGQTGSNIDDSRNDLPELFTDSDAWEKAVALWKALAARYRDRWIVGGYDLLNEPLRPGLESGNALHPYLEQLVRFYEEITAEIRTIDARHMLCIEGHRWATDTSIFFQPYDDNAVIHFHRYACMPGIEAFASYLALSERMRMPLWLGESGENTQEWFAAMFPLSAALGIGYNLWPWKKMACENSPLSVRPPDGWEEILRCAQGGPKPSPARARRILEEFLDNIRFERCDQNPAVTRAVFRKPGFTLRGTDFDEFPGWGVSYGGRLHRGNPYYRGDTRMDIVRLQDRDIAPRFAFDSGWDRLALRMRAGDFASYFIDGRAGDFCATLHIQAQDQADIEVVWRDDTTAIRHDGGVTEAAYPVPCGAGCGRLLIRVIAGTVLLIQIAVM